MNKLNRFWLSGALIAGLTVFGVATVSTVAAQQFEEAPPVLDGDPVLGEEEETFSDSGLQPLFVPSNEAGDPFDDEDVQEDETEYFEQPAVILRGLDKISGQSRDVTLATGTSTIFGGLRVTVRACHQAPPTEPPESVAYLEIEDYGFTVEAKDIKNEEVDREKRVFHGWMFASSPGLHGLEHPIYDVWVIRCTADVPDLSEAGSAS